MRMKLTNNAIAGQRLARLPIGSSSETGDMSCGRVTRTFPFARPFRPCPLRVIVTSPVVGFHRAQKPCSLPKRTLSCQACRMAFWTSGSCTQLSGGEGRLVGLEGHCTMSLRHTPGGNNDVGAGNGETGPMGRDGGGNWISGGS